MDRLLLRLIFKAFPQQDSHIAKTAHLISPRAYDDVLLFLINFTLNQQKDQTKTTTTLAGWLFVWVAQEELIPERLFYVTNQGHKSV